LLKGGLFLRYAVDGILYQNEKIVLIQRGGRTFHGFWALPGGILEQGEMVENTLVREMMEELGVKVKPLEILGVYSATDRDPREHTISTVFICDFSGELRAGDDAANYGLFTFQEIEKLEIAFDHRKIIQDFEKWLIKKETFWSSK
jgi:8-oxo-dGTP diphosphatase